MNRATADVALMRPELPVGIVGYGAYIPRYRIRAEAISRVWHGDQDGGAPIAQKSVPGPDEDVITMSIEAAANALRRSGVAARDVRAVWVGSESHPYEVKPTGTIVAEALGIANATLAADLEFACKAGTEAMQAATALVGSGMAPYALAIGMDTAQGRPGDALEQSAAAGGAAFLMGAGDEAIALLEGAYSFVSDTPDFWRRADQPYPSHGHRFTGEPAYFTHIIGAARALMGAMGLTPSDFSAAIFHQPNSKYPRRVAKQLGFTAAQIAEGLLAPEIGNCYAGSSPLGLARVLDKAQPGDRILIVSFGSGAGSDALVYHVTDRIDDARRRAPSTDDYLARKQFVDYATYARWRGKIR